jgi:hypothetical protein
LSPPFLDFTPEIRQQHVRVSKTVDFLDIPHMPMVAFACFVIVAQHTNSIDNKRQPIFEPVA